MRPLPNLTDLAQQPAVFDQSTDDFTQTFASEFTGTDTQQSYLNQQTPDVYAGMDPISQAIDALGAAMNDAVSVFDVLSGDLDSVNLDPIISDFQSQDSALDGNISNLGFDLSAGATILMSAMFSVGNFFEQDVINKLGPTLQYLETSVEYLLNQVSGSSLNGPSMGV